MEKKSINSQLTNFKTYDMYKRQMLTLAENVFEFKNMPKFIDTAYLNKSLLRKGSIAFFVDEVMRTFGTSLYFNWTIRRLRKTKGN